MKNIIIGLILFTLLFQQAQAWNLAAKHVNALSFDKNGDIFFTLFEEGTSGDEFQCSTGNRGQWFTIQACGETDQQCINAVDRMGSILLSAKLSGTAVHVQRNICDVTEAAIKPL